MDQLNFVHLVIQLVKHVTLVLPIFVRVVEIIFILAHPLLAKLVQVYVKNVRPQAVQNVKKTTI